MTDEELKAYAEHLIQQEAESVSGLSIAECYDEYRGYPVPDAEISDADIRKVSDLIATAKVTVSWE